MGTSRPFIVCQHLPMPPLPAIIIRHIHLPSITPFHIARSLQNHLVSQFLAYKASLSTPNPSAPPTPTILTFVPTPVYTTGRRTRCHLQRTASDLKGAAEPIAQDFA